MSLGRTLPAWLLATAWCVAAQAQQAPGRAAGGAPPPYGTQAPPPAATQAAPPPAYPPAQAPAYPPAQPAPYPAAQPPAPPAVQPAPPAWWSSYRPSTKSSAKAPLEITGSVLAGLGAFTLLAAGVTWLTAATESLGFDEDECPNHRCVEGTRGGDAYEATRDLANATDVLLVVALPSIGAGLSLVIIGAGLHDGSEGSAMGASVRATGRGATLEVTF